MGPVLQCLETMQMSPVKREFLYHCLSEIPDIAKKGEVINAAPGTCELSGKARPKLCPPDQTKLLASKMSFSSTGSIPCHSRTGWPDNSVLSTVWKRYSNSEALACCQECQRRPGSNRLCHWQAYKVRFALLVKTLRCESLRPP
jgi:hypothetical protein